jgi:hypothetical protein
LRPDNEHEPEKFTYLPWFSHYNENRTNGGKCHHKPLSEKNQNGMSHRCTAAYSKTVRGRRDVRASPGVLNVWGSMDPFGRMIKGMSFSFSFSFF